MRRQEEEQMEIWVVMDRRNRRFFGYSLNLLTAVADLAVETGGRAVALVMAGGDTPDFTCRLEEMVPCERAADEAVRHGAHGVLLVQCDSLDNTRADHLASGLVPLVARRQPRYVLFSLTSFGLEAAARSSAACGAGMIADCARISIKDGRLVAACPAWGGSVMAEITFADGDTPGFATVAPHICRATERPGAEGVIEEIALEGFAAPAGLQKMTSEPEAHDRQTLETAPVVVVGGAGLVDAKGFRQARELARAAGGVLGATRPPVMNKWVTPDRLIGQTGKSVRPRLLFSVGTSGAVQYTAGIAEAETIVAINRDAEAAIFDLAAIGVVADAPTFLPVLTNRIKQRLLRELADDLAREAGTCDQGFGERVQRLITASGWSREALARETGTTREFIRLVEEGKTSPPVSFLLGLATALKVDADTFLSQEEKTTIHDERSEAFFRRTRNYSYRTFTPGAEKGHLRAFQVTIDPGQDHKPVAYKHAGEEFIYVTEGELTLTLDGEEQHLARGETAHFNSEISHRLRSRSDIPTRLIVVLYTP
jgi:electron transfer flavoprotein alpha subunit